MGLSLFLVSGIANVFDNSGGGGTSGAEIYEQQAARIERELKKDPEDPEKLQALTRAQLNAGNQLVETTSEGQTVITQETVQMYRRASETWSQYLEATDQPSAGTAQLVAPTFVTLAEASSNASGFEENMTAAAEAAAIVAEQRPSL